MSKGAATLVRVHRAHLDRTRAKMMQAEAEYLQWKERVIQAQQQVDQAFAYGARHLMYASVVASFCHEQQKNIAAWLPYQEAAQAQVDVLRHEVMEIFLAMKRCEMWIEHCQEHRHTEEQRRHRREEDSWGQAQACRKIIAEKRLE